MSQTINESQNRISDIPSPAPQSSPDSRRRRRSRVTPRQRYYIIAICAAGALLSLATSDAAPTGNVVVDMVYRGGFVIMTSLAASRSRRWSLIFATGMVVVGSATYLLLGSLAAFAIASYLAWTNRRDRVLGAAIGALVSLSALNLVWPRTTGATAMIAFASVASLWISGYRLSARIVRRRIRRGVAVTFLLGLAGFAISGIAIAKQRDVVASAVSDTRKAVSQAGEGDSAASAQTFVNAAEHFELVANDTGGPWTILARLVPVAAQNLNAVHDAAGAGSSIARVAAGLVSTVDYERLRMEGGGIDLHVLADFKGSVDNAAAVLLEADEQISELKSPWLVRPLKEKLDQFGEQTSSLRSSTEIGALATRALPGLLGATEDRRYLMLLGNPAESRDIGGHIGTFVELSASKGILNVVRVSGPYDLTRPDTTVPPRLESLAGIPSAMLAMSPTRFPQNWGASPDLSVIADVASQLFPQMPGGGPIDGVLYADPSAFAAMLRLVGPVKISPPKSSRTSEAIEVSAGNAVAFLTRDQFDTAWIDRDPAKELVEESLSRLTHRRLPSVDSLANALSPVVRTGHLQFMSLHDEENQLLQRIGLDQRFQRPSDGDMVAVINRSAFPSKIDSYLQRQVRYQVSWDPSSGAIQTIVNVTMKNTAPTSGLPIAVGRSPEGTAPGTNRTVLSVISPLKAVDATVDGTIAGIGTMNETAGLRRHSIGVDIPAGESRTVRLSLRGSLRPSNTYKVRVYNQPLVNPRPFQIAIRSEGTKFVGGSNEGLVNVAGDRISDVTISTQRR